MPAHRLSTFDQWSNERTVPAARLVAFESWLLEQLRERLVWPTDQAAAEKQAAQCRAFVLDAVADLGDRGFLFRPRELAALLTEKLDVIARLQKAGNVRDLYPYFRAVWRSWVGANAEELRDKAMLCGSHVQRQLDNLVAGLPAAPRLPTLCELAAEVRRQRRAQRAANRASTPSTTSTESTPDLFNR